MTREGSSTVTERSLPWVALAMTGALLAGCVSAGLPTTPSPTGSLDPAAASPSAGPASADHGPTDAGPGSPPPSPTPSPTADPRPPLGFPDLQSHGTATITFTEPPIAPVTYELGCFWSPSWTSDYDAESDEETSVYQGATFAGVRALEPFSVTLASEPVDLWLGVGEELDIDPTGEWVSGHNLLVIHRHGAASYLAGPETGTVALVEASPDRTSGTIRFEGLAPDPETAPPGEVVLADWVKPLGGDLAMASLSGTVTWQCEPAPETIATYDPSVEDWPEGWPSFGVGHFGRCDAYRLVLVSGDQSRAGARACVSPCDNCGPGFYSLDADQTVRVPAGGTLRFELADPGTHFIRWSLSWATQSEAEQATQHEDEGEEFASPFTLIDEGRISEGPVLEFPAPPPGEWSVSIGWHDHPAGYESGSFVTGREYFRVLVGK